MSVKMKMALDQPCLMPSVCCACGSDASGSMYTKKATGSDLEGKHYVTLEFPLCETCGQFAEQVRATGFFQRRNQPDAAERKTAHKALKKQLADVERSASIGGVHYSAFGHGSMKLKFQNERFAQAFGAANGLAVKS